ncbi:MAG: AAA family ATPase [Candidatus Asgardarchaeia archaeon]
MKNGEKKAFDIAKTLKELSKQGVKKEEGFRVVITGKGGAGKTTIAALLSRLFAKKGYKVLAVDEDPQMNLPFAIGVSPDEASKIIPLSKNIDYIEEKTGARPGAGWGMMLRLNPDVDDVVERFGIIGPDDIRLLVMGTVVQAATGCMCPENALLNAVMNYITLRKNEVIIMDTQAGMEHFGRAIANGFSQAVIIMDPSFNSVQVGVRLAKLANQLNIKHIHAVINKIRNEKDVQKVKRLLNNVEGLKFDTIHEIPYDPILLDIEPSIEPLVTGEATSKIMESVINLMTVIEENA